MKRYITLIITVLIFISACKEKLASVTESWYDNGSPQKVLFYDIKNGDSILVKSIEYYPNRTVYIEGGYKDGKREGEWKSWYDNGNQWSTGTFKAGVQVGITMTYHENGNLRYSGTYNENGKYTGEWKFYDENGKLLETMKY